MKKRKTLLWLVFLSLCFFYCKNNTNPSLPKDNVEFMLPESALPVYESNLDHTTLLTSLDNKAYARGQVIYRTTCFDCHGDRETPGSIPNSLRFWQDTFKNGNDPHAMYTSVTRGIGRMPPQVQLVPRQKYDVIYFIQREFMRQSEGPLALSRQYLRNLPKGTELGPEPTKYEPWAEVDYGNFLIYTYELADSTTPPREISGGRAPLENEDYQDVNFAYKGIAVRLDEGPGGIAKGKAFIAFDHDLMRVAGAWTGDGFIDYEGILLNDRHNIYPRTVGKLHFTNPVTPAWANPATGDYTDPRFRAVDGRPFGPLPKEWTHYKGLYYHGSRVVVKYTVGRANVLETFDLEQMQPVPVFSRTLHISASNKPLKMRIAPTHSAVAILSEQATLSQQNGFHELQVPAGKVVQVKLFISGGTQQSLQSLVETAEGPTDLHTFTNGGPTHDTQEIGSNIIMGQTGGAYAVDVLTVPLHNPYHSRFRLSGIDFLPGSGQAVVCTVDGEVYQIRNFTDSSTTMQWKRIASGLFQPLGIKVHKGAIYVGCRDQIVVLRDLNGDGETDFYESFNNDHMVTEHFHEFAMGLQVGDAGNFYYAKSARHARTPLTPQHGTLIQVSADGRQSTILAHGFRAANGVCRNPDGSFFVTDQEGHWNPMNRINRVTKGGFYGNMYGYGAPADSSDQAMIPPLCWVDMKYDRSPSELLWVESDKWGPLNGSLLNLSYGYGRIFVVLPEWVNNQPQGGIVQLPIPQFPTGVMRGRFHPVDGQLYACGMAAWGTSQMIQVGGLYRVRYTGKELALPTAMKVLEDGLELTFATALDATTAENIANYTVGLYDLKRTRNYGSKRFNNRPLTVQKVIVEKGQKRVRLHIAGMQATWVMEVGYQLKSQAGEEVQGVVQSTVYNLGKSLME